MTATADETDGRLEVGRANPWHFDATPYIWFAGGDGAVTVGGFKSDVDVDFDDILEVIDFGAIGRFEATRGRWGVMTDLFYVKVSEDGGTPGPIISKIDVELEFLALEVSGVYAVRETDSGLFNKPTSLSLLAGIRYTDIDLEIDITAILPTKDLSGSKDWIDPFFGFRSIIEWTPRSSTVLRADIGGFGVGSDFVYQIEWSQVFVLNERLDLVVGYRYLDYDYEDGSGAKKFEFDVAMSGAVLGLNIKF